MPAKPMPGSQRTLIARLMAATGLSSEGCRKLLIRGTCPRNPFIAERWKRAMAKESKGTVK